MSFFGYTPSPSDYHRPYQRGDWEMFFDTFIFFSKDYEFALYNFCNTNDITLIKIDSPEEEKWTKILGQQNGNKLTAFIDNLYRIHVSERFLIENRCDCYMFATMLTHEILHYGLGHLDEWFIDKQLRTSPEENKIKNVLQDAIINALISRNFNHDPNFTKLFEQLYDANKSPENFLRIGSKHEDERSKEVYDDLYSKQGATTYEIRDCIEEDMDNGAGNDIVLIGGHGMGQAPGQQNQPGADGDKENQQRRKEGFENAAAEVAQQVVDNNKEYTRKDGDDKATDEQKGGKNADPYATELATYTLQEFINNAGNPDFLEHIIYPSSEPNFNSSLEKDFFTMKSKVTTRGILPTTFDRNQLMFRLLRIPQVFFRKPMVETSVKALAYIDVSGSTWSFHPVFISSIMYNLESFERVIPFSTVVDECDITQFEKKQYKSTGGTNDCWAHHMIKNDIKEAVVYTDGYFSGPSARILAEDPEVKLVVVYTSDGHTTNYFDEMKGRILSQYIISADGQYKKIG